MSLVPDDWTSRLAHALATVIRDFHRSVLKGSPVLVFDLGCYPWHGRIELSVLTTTDLDADDGLFDQSEIAAWPHYHFNLGHAFWRSQVDEGLAQQMAAQYHDSKNQSNRGTVVHAFLQACAETVATPEVTAVLNELSRDPRVQIWVQHPDTGRQFWPLPANEA